MAFLRYAAFIGLAAWVGGLAVLAGLAAPALFDVLQLRDPAGGRELAGLVFGEIFRRFQYVAWGAAALLLMSLGFRAALGPRPHRTAFRIWAIVAMVAMSVFTTFVIIPHIGEIRATVDGAVAALPATDPRRVEFGQWHALSSGLMLASLVIGLALAWAEVLDPH